MRAILMYHSIDASGSPVSLDAATFERHVAWLASGRAKVVPLCEIAAIPRDEDAVAVTFDDAFESFAEQAWPRLAEHGLHATVFVVSEHVGGTNLWGGKPSPGIPVLPLLGWDELGRLAEAGVELGAHGCTHRDLAVADRKSIEEELVGSRESIERATGVRASSFAYPFGRHGPWAQAAARRHFERACTTELAVLGSEPDEHLLPRLDAHYFRSEGGLEAWGSARFRVHLAARAGARRIRESLRPRKR